MEKIKNIIEIKNMNQEELDNFLKEIDTSYDPKKTKMLNIRNNNLPIIKDKLSKNSKLINTAVSGNKTEIPFISFGGNYGLTPLQIKKNGEPVSVKLYSAKKTDTGISIGAEFLNSPISKNSKFKKNEISYYDILQASKDSSGGITYKNATNNAVANSVANLAIFNRDSGKIKELYENNNNLVQNKLALSNFYMELRPQDKLGKTSLSKESGKMFYSANKRQIIDIQNREKNVSDFYPGEESYSYYRYYNSPVTGDDSNSIQNIFENSSNRRIRRYLDSQNIDYSENKNQIKEQIKSSIKKKAEQDISSESLNQKILNEVLNPDNKTGRKVSKKNLLQTINNVKFYEGKDPTGHLDALAGIIATSDNYDFSAKEIREKMEYLNDPTKIKREQDIIQNINTKADEFFNNLEINDKIDKVGFVKEIKNKTEQKLNYNKIISDSLVENSMTINVNGQKEYKAFSNLELKKLYSKTVEMSKEKGISYDDVLKRGIEIKIQNYTSNSKKIDEKRLIDIIPIPLDGNKANIKEKSEVLKERIMEQLNESSKNKNKEFIYLDQTGQISGAKISRQEAEHLTKKNNLERIMIKAQSESVNIKSKLNKLTVKQDYKTKGWSISIPQMTKEINKETGETVIKANVIDNKIYGTLQGFEKIKNIEETMGAIDIDKKDVKKINSYIEKMKTGELKDTKSIAESIDKLGEEFSIIDIETTGLDKESNEIIEVAIQKYKKTKDGFEAVDDGYNKLVKPKGDLSEIPKKITEITGITQEMLDKEGYDPKQVLEETKKYLGDSTIVGHNIDDFDLPFLNKRMEEHGVINLKNETVDTLTMSRKVSPNKKGRGQHTLGTLYGVATGGKEIENQHRAFADILANKVVLDDLINKGSGGVSKESYYDFVEKIINSDKYSEQTKNLIIDKINKLEEVQQSIGLGTQSEVIAGKSSLLGPAVKNPMGFFNKNRPALYQGYSTLGDFVTNDGTSVTESMIPSEIVEDTIVESDKIMYEKANEKMSGGYKKTQVNTKGLDVSIPGTFNESAVISKELSENYITQEKRTKKLSINNFKNIDKDGDVEKQIRNIINPEIENDYSISYYIEQLKKSKTKEERTLLRYKINQSIKAQGDKGFVDLINKNEYSGNKEDINVKYSKGISFENVKYNEKKQEVEISFKNIKGLEPGDKFTVDTGSKFTVSSVKPRSEIEFGGKNYDFLINRKTTGREQRGSEIYSSIKTFLSDTNNEQKQEQIIERVNKLTETLGYEVSKEDNKIKITNKVIKKEGINKDTSKDIYDQSKNVLENEYDFSSVGRKKIKDVSVKDIDTELENIYKEVTGETYKINPTNRLSVGGVEYGEKNAKEMLGTIERSTSDETYKVGSAFKMDPLSANLMRDNYQESFYKYINEEIKESSSKKTKEVLTDFYMPKFISETSEDIRNKEIKDFSFINAIKESTSGTSANIEILDIDEMKKTDLDFEYKMFDSAQEVGSKGIDEFDFFKGPLMSVIKEENIDQGTKNLKGKTKILLKDSNLKSANEKLKVAAANIEQNTRERIISKDIIEKISEDKNFRKEYLKKLDTLEENSNDKFEKFLINKIRGGTTNDKRSLNRINTAINAEAVAEVNLDYLIKNEGKVINDASIRRYMEITRSSAKIDNVNKKINEFKKLIYNKNNTSETLTEDVNKSIDLYSSIFDNDEKKTLKNLNESIKKDTALKNELEKRKIFTKKQLESNNQKNNKDLDLGNINKKIKEVENSIERKKQLITNFFSENENVTKINKAIRNMSEEDKSSITKKKILEYNEEKTKEELNILEQTLTKDYSQNKILKTKGAWKESFKTKVKDSFFTRPVQNEDFASILSKEMISGDRERALKDASVYLNEETIESLKKIDTTKENAEETIYKKLKRIVITNETPTKEFVKNVPETASGIRKTQTYLSRYPFQDSGNAQAMETTVLNIKKVSENQNDNMFTRTILSSMKENKNQTNLVMLNKEDWLNSRGDFDGDTGYAIFVDNIKDKRIKKEMRVEINMSKNNFDTAEGILKDLGYGSKEINKRKTYYETTNTLYENRLKNEMKGHNPYIRRMREGIKKAKKDGVKFNKENSMIDNINKIKKYIKEDPTEFQGNLVKELESLNLKTLSSKELVDSYTDLVGLTKAGIIHSNVTNLRKSIHSLGYSSFKDFEEKTKNKESLEIILSEINRKTNELSGFESLENITPAKLKSDLSDLRKLQSEIKDTSRYSSRLFDLMIQEGGISKHGLDVAGYDTIMEYYKKSIVDPEFGKGYDSLFNAFEQNIQKADEVFNEDMFNILKEINNKNELSNSDLYVKLINKKIKDKSIKELFPTPETFEGFQHITKFLEKENNLSNIYKKTYSELTKKEVKRVKAMNNVVTSSILSAKQLNKGSKYIEEINIINQMLDKYNKQGDISSEEIKNIMFDNSKLRKKGEALRQLIKNLDPEQTFFKSRDLNIDEISKRIKSFMEHGSPIDTKDNLLMTTLDDYSELNAKYETNYQRTYENITNYNMRNDNKIRSNAEKTEEKIKQTVDKSKEKIDDATEEAFEKTKKNFNKKINIENLKKFYDDLPKGAKTVGKLGALALGIAGFVGLIERGRPSISAPEDMYEEDLQNNNQNNKKDISEILKSDIEVHTRNTY